MSIRLVGKFEPCA